MIIDSTDFDPAALAYSFDVCIVGAGTSGLFLAHELSTKGMKVLIIEQGDDSHVSPEEFGKLTSYVSHIYDGADNGRSIGLGGTSLLWGGQLIPLLQSDFSFRPFFKLSRWPLKFSDLYFYYLKVLSLYGINFNNNSFDHEVNFSKSFNKRLSIWLPFSKRNQYSFFKKKLHSSSSVFVVKRALFKRFNFSNGRIDSAIINKSDGIDIAIKADHFVLTSGAIESTRLMLEFDQENNHPLTHKGSPLGKYFSDHLSFRLGRVEIKDFKSFSNLVLPIFQNGIMRTPRFELKSSYQITNSSPSAFAHFVFVNDSFNVIDFVKHFLRFIQGKEKFSLSPEMFNPKMFFDFVNLLYYRFFKKRLWIPKSSKVFLQVDIEQLPSEKNLLKLRCPNSTASDDSLVLDWQVSDRDVDFAIQIAKQFSTDWSRNGYSSIAEIVLTSKSDVDDSGASPFDVFHPTGSLRMGDTVETSVVDRDLKVWGVENLWISSTAVFPSSGSANPGLTHLALTSRLSDKLFELISCDSEEGS